jgi:hypothetical protein
VQSIVEAMGAELATLVGLCENGEVASESPDRIASAPE